MELIINENPKIQENWLWRKNVPFIYDYLFMTPLKWPTLSFSIPSIRFNSESMEIEQAMNDLESDPEVYSHGQLVVYGSYTGRSLVNDINYSESGTSDNYIAICLIDVPNFDIDLLTVNDMQKGSELMKPKYLNPDINTLLEISVEEDIFKICSTINDNKLKLASKTIKGKIVIHSIDIDKLKDLGMDLRKKSDYNVENNLFDNSVASVLLGDKHSSTGKSGYGMEWGTTNSNWLLSGNEDSSIYIYDLNSNNVIFESDGDYNLNGGINDLSWLNPDLTPNIFTTVSHQGNLSIYDFRINKKSGDNNSPLPKIRLRSSSNINSKTSAPVGKWNVSDYPCLSISVHPCISNLVSVGCYDGSIYLIDLRYFSNNKDNKNSSNKFVVNKLKYGKDGIHRVEWHGGGNGLLLSSSLDGKVSIWDITKSNNLPIWDQFYNVEEKKSNNHSVKSKEGNIHSENTSSRDDIATFKNSLKTIIGNKSSSWSKSERLEGPDELLGIHSGHFGHVTDSHWMYSPDFDSWTVASSDSSNGLHIWSFNEALFSSENDLIELAYAKNNPIFQNTADIFSTKASIQNLIDSF
ncbi:hypothetical protein FG379_002441 [Cryptosporidium bovis]|uniref:uncharacterized protein n=1 Tax=Cryptosporidium bovis TaxID=310047 RepID=UPI00351AAFE9|nr:hypothetical protein FG379_002441 [Cryptosporidium bovis]